MFLNCGVGEYSWESLGLQGDPTSPFWRRSVLGVHWRDWCWDWNSNTLSTWCEELTHWKRPWLWERLKAGGEGDDRGWDGWMASPTQWTWVWVNSRSWWWTGRPGVLQSMGRKELDTTELNWISLLFNMLSRLVIAVLPKSKRLLISRLQSPSAVILEPKNIKFLSFHCFPIYLTWSNGTRCHNLSFLNVEF